MTYQVKLICEVEWKCVVMIVLHIPHIYICRNARGTYNISCEYHVSSHFPNDEKTTWKCWNRISILTRHHISHHMLCVSHSSCVILTDLCVSCLVCDVLWIVLYVCVMSCHLSGCVVVSLSNLFYLLFVSPSFGCHIAIVPHRPILRLTHALLSFSYVCLDLAH